MRNVRIFSVIGFLRGMYFYIPIFTFFLLAEEVSLSAVVISQAVYSLCMFLGEVPTGLFADRYGQKLAIVLGYAVEVLGIVLVVLFPTALGLYISYGLRGVGGSLLSGSEEALLYESVRATGANNFQKVYGQFLSNDQVGFIVSATGAGLAYAYVGAASYIPLLFLTALCVGGAGVLSLFLADYRAEVQDPTEGSGMFATLKESFSLIRTNDTILTLTIVGVLTLGGEYFMQALYQPHFELNGVTAFWMGAVLSLGTAFSIVTSRYAYLMERYLSLEKIILAINLTLGACYLLVALLVHPVFLVGIYVVMNGLFSLQVPIVSDYINARTRSSIRSTVLSGISFVRRFFQMFVTWALGAAVGIFSIESSLVIQGAYLLIGAVLSYYLLVRCGCTYKVANSDGEEFEFEHATLSK